MMGSYCHAFKRCCRKAVSVYQDLISKYFKHCIKPDCSVAAIRAYLQVFCFSPSLTRLGHHSRSTRLRVLLLSETYWRRHRYGLSEVGNSLKLNSGRYDRLGQVRYLGTQDHVIGLSKGPYEYLMQFEQSSSGSQSQY